ncbi:MAG: trypsin-like peptidase domain-containing protein [Planctomycetales bacterium]|nr:trypsin-like peptidase domain-containing protein [Planctomycetales bacterium]
MDERRPPIVTSSAPAAEESRPPYALQHRLFTLLTLVVILLITPWFVERMRYAWTHGRQRAELDGARVALASPETLADAFRQVALNVNPSVVHIDASSVTSPSSDDEGRPRRGQRTYGDQGQGAGIVVSDDGYVLTNYHVVAGADEVSVRLGDGRIVDDVELVGVDTETDIVVLKIVADGLMPVEWGDSELLSVGDWVLAVGSPYGLDLSVTAGILSAKNRSIRAGHQSYSDLLQTDAAVNPGNSGGPLVDIQGRVVGINTAIVGETYGGISFALPSKTVQEVYQRLKDHPLGTQGLLGVKPQDMTAEIAATLRIDAHRGAIVTEVLPDSPALRAGIESYDVLLTWDGQSIENAEDLRSRVAATEAGRRIDVGINRRGQPLTLSVEVGRRASVF